MAVNGYDLSAVAFLRKRGGYLVEYIGDVRAYDSDADEVRDFKFTTGMVNRLCCAGELVEDFGVTCIWERRYYPSERRQ